MKNLIKNKALGYVNNFTALCCSFLLFSTPHLQAQQSIAGALGTASQLLGATTGIINNLQGQAGQSCQTADLEFQRYIPDFRTPTTATGGRSSNEDFNSLDANNPNRAVVHLVPDKKIPECLIAPVASQIPQNYCSKDSSLSICRAQALEDAAEQAITEWKTATKSTKYGSGCIEDKVEKKKRAIQQDLATLDKLIGQRNQYSDNLKKSLDPVLEELKKLNTEIGDNSGKKNKNHDPEMEKVLSTSCGKFLSSTQLSKGNKNLTQILDGLVRAPFDKAVSFSSSQVDIVSQLSQVAERLEEAGGSDLLSSNAKSLNQKLKSAANKGRLVSFSIIRVRRF